MLSAVPAGGGVEMDHVRPVLRMDPDAQPNFAIIGSARYQGRCGRHCVNLLELLRADLQQAGLGSMNTERQFRKLRGTVKDKLTWNNLIKLRN